MHPTSRGGTDSFPIPKLSPAQHGPGQRALQLEDVIFAMAFKVYSTVSTRRFMTDLKDAHAKGYVSQVASYNSIIRQNLPKFRPK